MLTDFFSLGGVEVANAVRLAAYLKSVGSPLDSVGTCFCPTLTPEMLGDEEYTDPAADDAPWYDANLPDSADFAGLLLLSVEGLDDYPVRRTVTNALTGGGVLGPARALPRTLVFTGLLLGATCCGVEYGLHWLSEVLQGCAGTRCDGDCLTLYTCCPGEELTEDCFNDGYRRTLRRVALVDGPQVIARNGTGCTAGECSKGADVLTVEFTLVAATPWLWTDPVPVIEVAPPRDESSTCVTWCIEGGADGTTVCLDLVDSCPAGSVAVSQTGAACDLAWPVDDEPDPCDATCRLADCTDPAALCADPMCQTASPPTVETPVTCYCLPLAVERQCCDIDLSECPAWSVDTPIFTVRAGSSELRNLTITIYERPPGTGAMTCEDIADAQRCSALSQFHIAYIPANGAVILDGQTGRATVECGGTCESSRDVYGADGGPLTFPTMGCATYVVCLETDVEHPPASDALVLLSVSGRGL